MKKKIIVWAVCAALLTGSALAAGKPSSWAAEAVDAMIAEQLVPGYLQSEYQKAMTREDFCNLMMVTLFFEDDIKNQAQKLINPFSDTQNPNIIVAYDEGLVSGKGDGSFAPAQEINRQEAAQMLYNYAQYVSEVSGVAFDDVKKDFPDSGQVASWAREAVQLVTGCGIMNGTDKGFEPQGSYTREQSILTFYNALSVLTVSGVEGVAGEEEKPQPSPEETARAYAAEVTELVNKVRAQGGLDPLTLDDKLTQIAMFKSQDMINTGEFKHTSKTYGAIDGLFARFKYVSTMFGENIAYGQKTPQEVVEAWVNSPPHYETMMEKEFTKTGVGYVVDKNGVPYWTQEFSVD